MSDNNKNLNGILILFVVIIVAVSLLSPLANLIEGSSAVGESLNETLSFSSYTATTSNDGVYNIIFFGNTTYNTHSKTLTVGTDINYTESGTITINEENFTDSKDYNISYDYYGDNYVKDSTSRTLLPITIILFVVALFAYAAGMGIGFFGKK